MSPFEDFDLKTILATEIVAGWAGGNKLDVEEPDCLDMEAISAFILNPPQGPERDRILQHLLSCSKCRVCFAQIQLMESSEGRNVTWRLRHVRSFWQANLPLALSVAGKIRAFLDTLTIESQSSLRDPILVGAEGSLKPQSPLILDVKGRLVFHAVATLTSPLEIVVSLEANGSILQLFSTEISDGNFCAVVDLSCCPGQAINLDWNFVRVRKQQRSDENVRPPSECTANAKLEPLDLEEVDLSMQSPWSGAISVSEVTFSDSAQKAAVLVQYINAYSQGNYGVIPEDAYDIYVEYSLDSFIDTVDSPVLSSTGEVNAQWSVSENQVVHQKSQQDES